MKKLQVLSFTVFLLLNICNISNVLAQGNAKWARDIRQKINNQVYTKPGEVINVIEEKEPEYLVDYALAERVAINQFIRLGYSMPSSSKLELVYQSELKAKNPSLRGQEPVPLFYVFNNPTKEGYIIVSGNKRTQPILGFSTESNFQPDQMPPALKYWLLKKYQLQIKHAIENNVKENHTKEWSTLTTKSPNVKSLSTDPCNFDNQYLLTTEWSQGVPYNQSYPDCENSEYGGKCLVGCVPLAMGQIMNYWKYPADYPWSLMDVKTLESPNPAIATLLAHCGQSLLPDIDYGSDETTAHAVAPLLSPAKSAEDSFVEDFFYENAIGIRRNFYLGNWHETIQDEILAGRPVLYSAKSDNWSYREGRHAFILDGYKVDENDQKYHINWCWGLTPKGWYVVDIFQEDDFFFNEKERAIIDLRPPSCTGGDISEYNDDQSHAYSLGELTEDKLEDLCLTEGDVDWFSFIHAGNTYYFKVSGGDEFETGSYGIDFNFTDDYLTIETIPTHGKTNTYIHLYDSDGVTELAQDLNGGKYCSFSLLKYPLSSSFDLTCTNLSIPQSSTDVDIYTVLGWPRVEGAVGYKLIVGTIPGSGNLFNENISQTTSETIYFSPPTHFPYGTDIYVQIIPYDNNGYADNCIIEGFTTESPPIPDIICTNLIYPTAGAIDVDVNTNFVWEAVPGAAGYYISVIGSETGFILDNVNLVYGGISYVLPEPLPYGEEISVTIVPYNQNEIAINCSTETFTTEDSPLNCNDGNCDPGEDCQTCPEDCGPCPPTDLDLQLSTDCLNYDLIVCVGTTPSVTAHIYNPNNEDWQGRIRFLWEDVNDVNNTAESVFGNSSYTIPAGQTAEIIGTFPTNAVGPGEYNLIIFEDFNDGGETSWDLVYDGASCINLFSQTVEDCGGCSLESSSITVHNLDCENNWVQISFSGTTGVAYEASVGGDWLPILSETNTELLFSGSPNSLDIFVREASNTDCIISLLDYQVGCNGSENLQLELADFINHPDPFCVGEESEVSVWIKNPNNQDWQGNLGALLSESGTGNNQYIEQISTLIPAGETRYYNFIGLISIQPSDNVSLIIAEADLNQSVEYVLNGAYINDFVVSVQDCSACSLENSTISVTARDCDNNRIQISFSGTPGVEYEASVGDEWSPILPGTNTEIPFSGTPSSLDIHVREKSNTNCIISLLNYQVGCNGSENLQLELASCIDYPDPFCVGEESEVSVSIKNPNNQDWQGNLGALLSESGTGNNQYIDQISTSIPAGETHHFTFTGLITVQPSNNISLIIAEADVNQSVEYVLNGSCEDGNYITVSVQECTCDQITVTLNTPNNGAVYQVGEQVHYSWQSNIPITDPCVQSYQIQLDDNSGFSSPEDITRYSNTYNDSYSSPGTYYWRVRARNELNEYGSWSGVGYVIIEDNTGSNLPLELANCIDHSYQFCTGENGTVSVGIRNPNDQDWSGALKASFYEAGNSQTLQALDEISIPAGEAISVDFTGLVSVQASDNLVLTISQIENEGEWNDVGHGSCQNGIPIEVNNCSDACPVPSNLQAVPTNSSATVSWNEVPGTTGYKLIWREGGTTRLIGDQVVSGNVNSFTISGLETDMTYYWQIKSYCTDGTSSYYSSPHPFSTTIASCNPPTNLREEHVTGKYAKLSWTPESNTDGDALYWREVGSDLWKVEAIIYDDMFELFGLQSQTSYEWLVRSRCLPDGISTWSASKNFTTTEFGCADFELTNLEITSYTDSEITFSVTVTNIGNEPAYIGIDDFNPSESLVGIQFHFSHDNILGDDNDIAAGAARFIDIPSGYLLMGDSQTRDITINHQGICYGYLVTTVDYGNIIPECSDNNNRATAAYNVDWASDEHLSVSNVTDVTAKLQWDQVNDKLYRARYRLRGESSWHTSLSFLSFHNWWDITDLETCSEYEWQVSINCPSEIGDYWSDLAYFTTECTSCSELIQPLDGSVDVPRDQDLIWQAAEGTPLGYRLTVGTTPDVGNILNDLDVGNVTTYPLPTLANNAEIYVTIKPYYAFRILEDCPISSFQVEASASNCSWSTQTTNVTDYLNDIFMVDQEVGYAVGTYYRILKTTDGGANWNSIYNTGSFGSWNAVHFLDRNIGWVAGFGGKIWKTVDGGGNWTPQVSNTGILILDLFFKDANNGWAVGSSGLIVRTIDGGQTWSPRYDITFEGLNAISFPDGLNGWAVGTNGVLITTNDGGETWSVASSGTTSHLSDVFFVNDQVGWIIGGGVVRKTTDGGSSWVTQYTDLINYYKTCYFLDELTGWIAGSGGIVLQTVDGGQTWVQENVSETVSFTEIVQIETGERWMSGADGIIMYSDCYTDESVPGCTVLTSPINGSTEVSMTSLINWLAVVEAIGYRLTVSTSPGGNDILNDEDVGNITTYDPGPLPGNTTIYVAIIPYNDAGDATGCMEESFSTEEVFPCTVVVNTNDSGPGSLREALDCSNNTTAVETITFNIPGSGPHIITPLTDLPYITNTAIIDATTQPGYFPGSIVIDGSSNATTGLAMLANNSEIYGLHIRGFDSGFVIFNVSNCVMGSVDKPNYATDNHFGLFLGNSNSSHNNQINGNYFGLDPFGENEPNTYGINIFESANNLFSQNTFANNEGGVFFDGSGNEGNQLLNNSFYCNDDPFAGNGPLNTIPLISEASLQMIQGTSDPDETIEIYKVFDSTCQQACQGRYLLGTTLADGNGNWSLSSPFQVILNVGDMVTAMATEVALGSSGFSSCFIVTASIPNCTALVSPLNGATGASVNAVLSWDVAIGNPTGYKLTVGTTSGGSSILNNENVGNVISYDIGTLPENTTIYVTIIPYNENGEANGCVEESFTTECLTLWYADTDGDSFGDPNNTIMACNQPAGFVGNNTDCDDDNTNLNPAAQEICDGIDNDCDGLVDAADDSVTGQSIWYADADGDSYGNPNVSQTSCIQPSGYVLDDTDCDDGNADINLAAQEICDGLDNDCDGLVDGEDDSITGQSIWYADTDGDSYGDSNVSQSSCTQPSGYVLDDTDCDDGNADINPAAQEICDGLDNDCDGLVDDEDDSITGQSIWYADIDGDSYGDPNTSQESCIQPSGYVLDNTDCDDGNANINPAAQEICDGIDNDCNGQIDEAYECSCTYRDSLALVALYDATDGPNWTNSWNLNMPIDTWHGVTLSAEGCVTALDLSNNQLTGNIPEALVNLSELQNLLLNDNQLQCFESGLNVLCNNGTLTQVSVENNPGDLNWDDFCTTGAGDCAGPGMDVTFFFANEQITNDGVDDFYEVDVLVESTSGFMLGSGLLYITYNEAAFGSYVHGNGALEITTPENYLMATTLFPPSGYNFYTPFFTNDNDRLRFYFGWFQGDFGSGCLGGNNVTSVPAPLFHIKIKYAPGGLSQDPQLCFESSSPYDDQTFTACGPSNVCAPVNCNSEPFEQILNDYFECLIRSPWYADMDGDGFGDPDNVILAGTQPAGYVLDNTDCDDGNADINPAAQEICDGLDNDCDGLVDDEDDSVTGQSIWYADTDGDSYGDPNVSQTDCTQPAGYVLDNTDCDDTNANINPSAPEICDGVDNNCDGAIDEGLECDETLTANVYSIYPGDEVQFTYNLSELGTTNVLNFGDGTTTTITDLSGTITHNYAREGMFKVRLLKDDVEVGVVWIQVKSCEWISYVTSTGGYREPFEDLCQVLENSVAHIDPSLSDRPYYWTNFSNYNDFPLDGDAATLEIRFKNSPSEGGISCFDTGIQFFGETGAARVVYMQPGCTQYASIYAGNTFVSGSSTDLSTLGQSMSNWSVIKLVTQGGVVSTYFNGELTYSMPYEGAIGMLKGLHFNFKGSGSIDWIKLRNEQGEIVYMEEFDHCECDELTAVSEPTISSAYNNEITILYPEPIDRATLNATNLRFMGDEAGQRQGTYSSRGNAVKFRPNYPFRTGEKIMISSLADLQDVDQANQLPYTWELPAHTTNPTSANFAPRDLGITLPADALNASVNIAPADVNRDGLSDLIIRYHTSGSSTKILVYTQLSDGTYSEPANYTNSYSYSGLAGTPDFNNDGYPDILISHNVPSRAHVRLNNGDGTYSAPAYYTVTNYCNGFTYGDIDRDGDIDIVGIAGNASLSANTISLLRNNGDGTFAGQETINTGVFGHGRMLADLDNDGDLDLIYNSSTSFSSTPTYRVYENNGGSYSLYSNISNPSVWRPLAVHDFDRDGLLDIVNGTSNVNIEYGSGNLDIDPHNGILIEETTSYILAGDVNGDGWMDLFNGRLYDGSSWETMPFRTYLNQGDRTFQIQMGSGPLSTKQGLKLSDGDSDGDLDAFYMATDGKLYMLENGACHTMTWYADNDSDGFGDPNNSQISCTQPANHVLDNTDCDDGNAAINPETTWYADTDGDGYGDPNNSQVSCTQPANHVLDNTDCDDTNTAINPETIWYADTDGDGYGDPDNSQVSCTPPANHVLDNTDCDDTNIAINPETIWYADTDGDGYGDPDNSQVSCTPPANHVLDNTDCDDTNTAIHPETIWYADTDGDGYGDPNNSQVSCTPPANHVLDNTDCDDTNIAIHPETIWYADTDGDGYGDPDNSQVSCTPPANHVLDNTDCDDTNIAINPETIWYADTDGDGYGDPDNSQVSCTPPANHVLDNTDCDDTNTAINPETIWFADTDGDGYGDPNNSQVSCTQPADHVLDNNDCDDGRNDIYPSAPELCDGVDNDCNGQIDEAYECGCSYRDSLALVALYHGTDGANWTNTWDLSMPMETWYGVTLSAEGCVSELDLNNNQLSGSIPLEMGHLANLINLTLHTNQLSGNIPGELGNLSNLTWLWLYDNQLSGSIPIEIGSLTNLNRIYLQNNQLSGCFPESFQAFCNIDYDFTSNPQLPWQGDFSRFCNDEPQIGANCDDGNPETVNDIIQADCGCLGKIINPCRMQDSLSLVALYNATGGANWTNTWDLNQPMPTWYGVTINGDGCVIGLDLQNNQLSGDLPPEIGDLINLEELYLNDNQLTGAIPPLLGNLINLSMLDLSFNQLSESIPAEFGDLTNLIRLDLSDNQLTGDIPPALSELPNLTWLDLSNNPLSENVLTQLSSLPNLTELYLRDMQLSGEIPAELANLTDLVSLDLSNNQFTGTIPPELGNLTNLVVLNLSGNQLTGPIPPELGDIVNLASPDRYYRLFESEPTLYITDLMNRLSPREVYRQLSGNITLELANLANLTLIDLSDNQLSGCFPASLQVYCNITYDFSNNPQLPWQGDFSRFCNEETQIGAVCDDGDPATINDQITTDCECQGVPAGLRITPKVYLQGPYNPTTGFMNDHLRDNNLLPQTEPYDALGYTLVGSGGETVEPSVFETTGPDAIVDWVFLELRDKSDPTMVLATRSALLQADGDVVDTDGVAPVNFADLPPDDYYLVIKHRNHLGVMTAAPVALTGTPTSIDFTTDFNQVAGGANGIGALPDGKLGMYSGDFNGNGQVQNTDYASMVLTLGTAGYLPGDFDLNGQVQNTDLQLQLVPNIGRGAAFEQ